MATRGRPALSPLSYLVPGGGAWICFLLAIARYRVPSDTIS